MKIEEIKESCIGCGACKAECPSKCISFEVDMEGFYYPSINREQCIQCKKCEMICPVINRQGVSSIEKHSYYGFSLNDNIRKSSSSGGVFAAIAGTVLDCGGNVYGAAFDYDDLILKHKSTDDIPLTELQKSKYIESYMGDTIERIKDDLSYDRKVLFCGTPCQAAGVYSALGHHKNLLICDFVCHGVPSAIIFKDYIKKIIHNDEKLIGIDFRPKEYGWSGKFFRLVIKTTKKTKSIPHSLDVFYKGFVTDNAFLRKSCYKCGFRDVHFSDITIGDFWGFRQYNPELNDEKGLSLIVTHSPKGDKALEKVSEFRLQEIDNKYTDYAFEQRDYSKFYETRKKFYAIYTPGNLKKAALRTYMKKYYLIWAKYLLKKMLGKL